MASSATYVPPTSELFDKHQLVARHPNLLNEHRLTWSIRNRFRNGLSDAGAVFDSRSGALLIHEPSFLQWYLRLSGRSKPRASTRRGRA